VLFYYCPIIYIILTYTSLGQTLSNRFCGAETFLRS